MAENGESGRRITAHLYIIVPNCSAVVAIYMVTGRVTSCSNNTQQTHHSALPDHAIYRVSQEEWIKLQESVPYVKLYRYNSKHLYPKLNGYGDNGHQKVWSSCGSMHCTSSVTR
jgi:hypothetical protein